MELLRSKAESRRTMNKADLYSPELAATATSPPASVHTDRAIKTNSDCATQDHTFAFRRCDLGIRRCTTATT